MKLIANGLVKRYRKRTVVNDVSFEVEQGQIVGLLGPNGAGKTTSFYMVVGLVRPDAGSVFLDGEDLTHLPMYKRAQRGVGYLPQEASVFRKLSVEDNLKAVLEMTKLTRGEQNTRMETLLEEFGLGSMSHKRPDQLSGGERQRVALARALVNKPLVVLADEPTGNLDSRNSELVFDLFARLAKDGQTIVAVTHDMELAKRADRRIRMVDGRVVADEQ
jgi:lipopolysaccharide export system ATP-binding protein